MAMRRGTLYCSFCGKMQTEVTDLIAGPTVFICNECVALCSELIAQRAIERAVKAAPLRQRCAECDCGDGDCNRIAGTNSEKSCTPS